MDRTWIMRIESVIFAIVIASTIIISDLQLVFADTVQDDDAVSECTEYDNNDIIDDNESIIAEEYNKNEESLTENVSKRITISDDIDLEDDSTELENSLSENEVLSETDSYYEEITPDQSAVSSTRDDAIAWLWTQDNVGYDFDGSFGCQCVEFASAYRNWLWTGNPWNDGTVYWAEQFLDLARADGWQIIENQADTVPQPGDIFISGGTTEFVDYYGRSMGVHYRHIGVVISSTVSTATVIDQNAGAAAYYDGYGGYRAQIHDISWGGYYYPNYFIRPDWKTIPTPEPEKKGGLMTSGYDRVVPDGNYQIVSDIDSNYALDIQGYEAKEISDGSNAQLFRNRNVNQDVFQLTYSGGFYKIKHVLSGKCLDVYGGSEYNKTNVQAWTDNGSNAQRWAIKSAGDGINYNIEAKCSGFRLDACGAVAEDRTNLWVHEANTSSAQKWRLVPYPSTNKVIENGNYHIQSRMEDGPYLTVSGTSGNFRNVTAATNKLDNSQVFNVTFESGTNSYIIKQKNTKYYLEVENCGRTRNIGVATGDSNGNSDGNWKKWNIMSFGSGWYGLVSRETGEGIYYNARNKGNVTVSTSNSAYYDQYWLFYRAVDSVSISQSTATVNAGSNVTLKATVSPAAAKNKDVTWTSSNTNVATVNGSGVVTAKSAGTATITVKTVDGGYTASCKVTVNSVKVSVTGVTMTDKSGIVLTAKSPRLLKGKTYTFKAVVTPSDATNKNVTWSSNNTSVATVTSDGVVTTKSEGEAMITVRTVDGDKGASCMAKVGTAPTITTASIPYALLYSQGYSATLQASGTAPITFSIVSGSLPGGFTLKDGKITGSPTGACGVSTFTIQAKNEYGTSEKQYSMAVVSAAKILYEDGDEIMEGYVGENYNGGIDRQGDGLSTGEYICIITSGSLPDGLVFDNGTITGVPTKAGKYMFSVRVENKYGSDSKQLCITIKPAKHDDSGKEEMDIIKSGAKTIVVGQKLNLKEACFADVDANISRYIVDNKKIASVSKGMLTGLKAGTVKVTAQKAIGKNKYEDVASCDVNILNKPKLKFGIPLTYEGQLIDASYFFTTEDTNTIGATYWESSNSKVVEVVDSEKGILVAHKSGSASISAYFGEKGKKGTLKVTAKINVKYPAFQKKSYKIQTGVNLTLAMKNVTVSMNPEWRAADPDVISVTPQIDKKGNPTGKVTVRGLSYGDTTLIATIHGREYYTEIHVAAPKISKSKLTLKTKQTGTIALKNTKLKKTAIEWYSSDPGVAMVNSSGKITGISVGECRIYTETGGVLNECFLTVK